MRARRLLAAGLGALACAWIACSSDADRRDAHLAKADAYLAEGKQREGLLELRSALRLDPLDADINFRIGELMYGMGNIPDALFFYRETHRLDPERLDAVVKEAELQVLDLPETSAELIDGVLERDPANAAAYVVRSKVLVVQADLPAALQAALTALELAPDDFGAQQQLGKVHQARILAAQRAGETVDDAVFEEAAAAFERLTAMSVEKGRWLGLWQKAKVLASWPGHDDEAEAAFRDTLGALAESDPTRQTIGLIAQEATDFARRAGKPALVKETIEFVLAADPTALDSWGILARVEEQMGGSPDPVLERMLEANPGNLQAQLRYVSELSQRGRRDEAIAHLEGQVESAPDQPTVLAALENLLFAAGRGDEARAVFERLERDHPDHPLTGLTRAQVRLRENRPQEAAAELRLLVDRSESVQAWHLLAVTENQLGNRAAALSAAERAIDLARNASFPEASFRLQAQLLAAQGSWRDALRSFFALLNNGKTLSPMERVLEARCLYGIGMRPTGRAMLETYGNLDGDRPYLGAVLEFVRQEGKEQPERAQALVERALAITPLNPALLTQFARMELAEGRTDRALERINAAVASGRATVPLLLVRGRIYAARGEVDAAQRDALQAFEASPNSQAASSLLLALYRAQGKEAEVIESFEEADAAGALRAPARLLLAKLHLGRGNSSRGRELLEAVIAERADLPVAKNDLAYLLAQEGTDLGRAQTLAEEAAQSLGEEPAVADTLGYVYLRKGLTEAALGQFRFGIEQAEEQDQLRSLLHYHEGLALRELGRSQEAADAFGKALALNADLAEAARALEELGS